MKKSMKSVSVNRHQSTRVNLSIHSFDQQISIPYFAPGQNTGVTIVNKIFTTALLPESIF